MKLAIVGSRSFTDYEKMKSHILMLYNIKSIEIIISGGAIGTDSLAERFAKENSIPTNIIKPDWDKYGKSAGYLRNIDIISSADEILIFWDGVSKGTKNDIELSEKYRKPYHIITINKKLDKNL